MLSLIYVLFFDTLGLKTFSQKEKYKS